MKSKSNRKYGNYAVLGSISCTVMNNSGLVVQNEINCTKEVIEKAYDKGMKIILNPSPITDSLLTLDLNMIDYLVMNETETMALSSCKTINEATDILLNKYPKIKLVITLGADGVKYVDKDKSYYQEAYQAQVIDTTAAGDTFLGYFVASLVQKNDIEEALQTASKAASLAVSQKGAYNSIPDISMVKG